jgi:small subunit ribosomal protein S20
MPHTKSAWKRLRQSEKRRRRNRRWIKQIKLAKKELLGAIQTGDSQKAMAGLQLTTKKLDKAAARGVIHRNKAARVKSRLSKKMNALSKPTSEK